MGAGYSETPLARKLGLRPHTELCLVDQPPHYLELVAPLPDGVSIVLTPTDMTDIVHLFTRRRRELARSLRDFRSTLHPSAVVWVSWPKQASGIETEVTKSIVRQTALPFGWVDVKICAVDDVWSGLKLVVRRELRDK